MSNHVSATCGYSVQEQVSFEKLVLLGGSLSLWCPPPLALVSWLKAVSRKGMQVLLMALGKLHKPNSPRSMVRRLLGHPLGCSVGISGEKWGHLPNSCCTTRAASIWTPISSSPSCEVSTTNSISHWRKLKLSEVKRLAQGLTAKGDRAEIWADFYLAG